MTAHKGGAMSKYKVGEAVVCNGNKQGRVIGYYSERMVEVRLWDGFRHVGDVCTSEHDLDLENHKEATNAQP